MNKFIWIALYIIVLVAHLLAIYFQADTIQFISKPLLVPLVAINFLIQTRPFASGLKPWILLALFFSWTGDILLMFETKGSIFFLMGLSAFLLAQVFYIIFFNGVRMREKIRGNVFLLILVVVYYGILINLLSPYLGKMKLPVEIYGVVLSFMLMLSMHTLLGKNKKAGAWMMIGGILFVASDSLLAFNKFYAPLSYAGLIIMLTYGLAQLFISYGASLIVKNEK